MATQTTYSQIRSQLQTGDLLGFEGNQPLDWMINMLERALYSHVGMVLRDAEDTLWFWDAPGGGDTFPDPYWPNPNQPNTGCRVANLDDLLKYYVGEMGNTTFTWRQLTPSLPYTSGSTLETFIAKTDGAPFPGQGCNFPPEIVAWIQQKFGQADLVGAELGIGLLITYLCGAILNVPTAAYFYCAQLVAATYMTCGVLQAPPDPANPSAGILPPNGYTPANFMEPLQLLSSYQLQPPVEVGWDGPSNSVQTQTNATGTRPAAMGVSEFLT